MTMTFESKSLLIRPISILFLSNSDIIVTTSYNSLSELNPITMIFEFDRNNRTLKPNLNVFLISVRTEPLNLNRFFKGLDLR